MADHDNGTPDEILFVTITSHPSSLSEHDISMAGPATRAPAPASKASIDALKVVKSREEEKLEEECAICLQNLFNMENNEVVVKETPCWHKFHGECIEKWLEIRGSCPLCRYKMWNEDGEVESDEDVEDSDSFWDTDMEGVEIRFWDQDGEGDEVGWF